MTVKIAIKVIKLVKINIREGINIARNINKKDN